MTSNNQHQKLEIVLQALMTRYKERVPDVQKITDALVKQGVIAAASDIENDHIAFRTMGVPLLGIQSLERIFLHYGYIKQEYLFFAEKKLDAYWYAPPSHQFPRIFISELRVKDLSQDIQDIIYSYTNEVKQDPTLSLDLNDAHAVGEFLHSSLWRLPSSTDFDKLAKASEYASWVIYNRYYLNHFTVSVHNLPRINTLDKFNDFLESIGIILNDAGGKIKTSPDKLLLQSSSVSQMIDARFSDGVVKKISGSYVEFAERKILPQFQHLPLDQIRREHRRDGFESQNADKIFESTYSTQTQKATR